MTGCERILARLEEGPATAAELYRTTYTVVHSRIADLRRRGYVITCEHLGGKGPETYLYRLLDSPSVVAATEADGESSEPAPSTADELTASGSQRVPLPPPARSTQLTLEAA